MLKIHALVAVSLLAAGCSSVPEQVDANLAASIKRIGIVAVVGDEIELRGVGATVFGNRRDFIPVESMGLNELIYESARAVLVSNGRYTVNRVPASSKLFDRMYGWSSQASPVRLDLVKTELGDLAGRCGCDALLLFTRTVQPDLIGGTNQLLVGLGVYARTVNDEPRSTAVYTAYHSVLLDARTLEALAGATSTRSPEERYRYALPWKPIAASAWPRGGKAPTPEQIEIIGPQIRSLLSESVPNSLKAIGLTK